MSPEGRMFEIAKLEFAPPDIGLSHVMMDIAWKLADRTVDGPHNHMDYDPEAGRVGDVRRPGVGRAAWSDCDGNGRCVATKAGPSS